MKKLLILTIILLSFDCDTIMAQNERPLYKDATASINDRVEDLLKRMTIEEKIGQMSQIDISVINTTGNQAIVTLDEEKARDYVLNHKVGSFINGEAVPAQDWYDFIYPLARIASQESRLGIPIIYGIDHVHGGSYMQGTTIFPQAINLAATFDTKHSYNMGWVTALETADVGHHWNFGPTLDLGVNQIWPRLYETFGEDPVLASQMGVAYIDGYQGNEEIYPYKVAANAKHFIAYSDPVSGWDKTPVQVGMQQLRELHLPAFRAAIDAGVRTIMANSSEVNGTPTHASYELLTELLRNELGFEGVILTDWDEVGKLMGFHKTAPDYKESTYRAVKAGIDVSMTPLHLNFNHSLLELYNEGRISEERIDESVRRVLKLKFELGLFENPLPRNDRFDRIGSAENKEMALNAARESIVLLKNENGVLPLQNPIHIIVAGPSATNKRNLAGGWTLSWQGGRDEQFPAEMHTVYTALKAEFPNATVELLEEFPSILDERFLAKLDAADALIYVGGEEPYSEFLGNITDLALPQTQRDEIKLLTQSSTPTILVLVQGRPRIITDVYSDINSLVHAGLPGFEGAQAIANVLSGAVNPSGKLPFSYPKYSGHYLNYNHKPSDLYFYHPDNQNTRNNSTVNTMLYQFGDGISYTSFAYSDLEISATDIQKEGIITAKVTVTNTGEITGSESVLWYLTNLIGMVSRPVKELKHFEKVSLGPGESITVSFEIRPEVALWYPDAAGNQIFEEGEFIVRAGDLSVSFFLKN